MVIVEAVALGFAALAGTCFTVDFLFAVGHAKPRRKP
jgi:hypothetical protein